MHGAAAILLAAAMGAGRPVIPARKPRPLAATTSSLPGSFTLTVTPATLTFIAINPGAVPVVPASSLTSVFWQTISGNNNWSLRVQAKSPTFSNCPTVPVSAVTVSCASANVYAFGGSAACSGPFPLSTTAAQVAGGAEGLVAFSYSATINFTLADNWKYIAETTPPCALSLTYTADVP